MFWQTATAEAGTGGPADPGWGPAPGRLLSCEQELLAVRADLAGAAAAWVSPAGRAFRERLHEYRSGLAEAAELLRLAAAAVSAAEAAAGAAKTAAAAMCGPRP